VAQQPDLQALKSLRGALRSRLGEPLPRLGGFTEQEITLAINFAQYEVARRLLRLHQSWFNKMYTFSIQSGVVLYDLPTNCLEIIGMTWGGKNVIPLSLSDYGIIESNPNYEPSQDDSYYIKLEDQIKVSPIPGTETGGQLLPLVVFYVQSPTDLAEDTDKTIIPKQFCDLLIRYAYIITAPKIGKDATQAEKFYDEAFQEMTSKYLEDKILRESLPGERLGKPGR
jgi:hypothetical protein